MTRLTFEQQIEEILSSTKKMDYADYRRLMRGESSHGCNNRSLLDFIECPVDWDRFNDKMKIEEAVISIAYAMGTYIKSSPAPNTYKQRIYVIFCNWLDRIGEKYNVKDTHKDYMKEPIKEDKGIAFLKAFHKEKPVTKKEIAEKLVVDRKTVQTWLRKIDPKLSEDGNGNEGEYRIAGHHVMVDIEQVGTGKYDERFYKMPSTIHPLVLQPNVMQVGVLLKSLCLSYNTMSYLSYDIALDIWSQLSDYAKERIRENFGKHDECLEEFLEKLTEELNGGEKIRIFKTEQELMRYGEKTMWEKIGLALKNSSKCNIWIRDEQGNVKLFEKKRIVSRYSKDGYIYVAIPYVEDKCTYEDEEIMNSEISASETDENSTCVKESLCEKEIIIDEEHVVEIEYLD